METDDIAEWLTAIWDEDEARLSHPTFCGPVWPTTDQLLARIAADRQILTECSIVLEGKEPGHMRERVLAWTILRLLASVHRDRPGWREAWQ